MQRIEKMDLAKAEGRVKEQLDSVKAKVGRIPNIYATMATAPAVLEMYLSQGAALARASLGSQLRERLAITTGAANGCEYCVSAHTAIGRNFKISDAELALALKGESADPKTAAALKFARLLLENRGRVSDAELTALLAAGYTGAQALEIVAMVAANIFTNYFNLVAGTEVDFPRVALR
ncbi:MAG: carboxymuconolactone decarboxylase family protein [Elusimicrobia bacterium]|nr:carboxymuconolactone decarboxylase family protein [Elusimicrobiota bacterium]